MNGISAKFGLSLLFGAIFLFASCSSKSRPTESVVVQMAKQYYSTTYTVESGIALEHATNPHVIEYGETQVSEGSTPAKGRNIYPVKIGYDRMMRSPWTNQVAAHEVAVWYFYKDEFGNWAYYIKR